MSEIAKTNNRNLEMTKVKLIENPKAMLNSDKYG